eukprot:c22447_g1_i1 orf=103-1431(+)
MSSCSTEKIGADVQEDVASCSSILLNLGAGCTAPPPTPMASALSNGTDNLLSSAIGSCAAACAHEDDSVLGLAHTKPTLAPTRADLDALAHYLMQQSLLSTPTLNLAASPTAQRKRRSLTCSPPAPAATSIDVIAATGGQEVNPASIDAISATTGEQEVNARGLSDDQLAVAVQTYCYSGRTSMGFCEESRRGIQTACQEMGAFYITVAMQEYVDVAEQNMEIHERGDASSLGLYAGLEHLLLQLQLPTGARSSSMCVLSGPLVPLSELLISPHQLQTSTISSLVQEDDAFQLLDLPVFDFEDTQTFQAAIIDTNFRETMTKCAKVLFEISKNLIKLLLEDLCVETQANMRGQVLKPLLYIYNNGTHGKSNYVEHDDDGDVVLSLSHGIVNQSNNSVSLQAIVGNQLETWSKGKYKALNLDSLCNAGSGGEVRIQLDLIQHQ